MPLVRPVTLTGYLVALSHRRRPLDGAARLSRAATVANFVAKLFVAGPAGRGTTLHARTPVAYTSGEGKAMKIASACPKCKGRSLTEELDGDLSCWCCGFVEYHRRALTPDYDPEVLAAMKGQPQRAPGPVR